MSNRPEGQVDRRDFMIASIATAGASAALAVTAAAANAQGRNSFDLRRSAQQPARQCAGASGCTNEAQAHWRLLRKARLCKTIGPRRPLRGTAL
jgi:hypothetical protein